jgi:hypothetical protein
VQRDLAELFLARLDNATAAAPPLGDRREAEEIIHLLMEREEINPETGTRLLRVISRVERNGYASWPTSKTRSMDEAMADLTALGITPIVNKRRGVIPPGHCRPANRVVHPAAIARLLRQALTDQIAAPTAPAAPALPEPEIFIGW